jgi:hypothetical protein
VILAISASKVFILLVLLIPLAHFVFYVLRSCLFDAGIEDLFLDGRVHFQGVFYLTERAGLLFTVALFQVVFLLEQFFDRRMISSSTTQLRPGAPLSLPPSCIARTREDRRITASYLARPFGTLSFPS